MYVIIRQAPDVDEYVLWDTSTERPLAVGGRAEIAVDFAALFEAIAEMHRDTPALLPEDVDIEARLDHTDLHGSSMIQDRFGIGHWDDPTLIYDMRGLLPRTRLAQAARLLLDDHREAEVWDLLQPFEDGTPVRRGYGP